MKKERKWEMGTIEVMAGAPTWVEVMAALDRIETKIDAIWAALRRRRR